jgi:hypothetical protein
LLFLGLFAACTTTKGQDRKLSTREAKNHIDQHATVCGRVVGWRHVPASFGNPTLLDLDKSYPNQPFTVFVWEKNRASFRDPEGYRNKNVCVTGRIESHRGAPEMIISNPAQLTMEVEPPEQ